MGNYRVKPCKDDISNIALQLKLMRYQIIFRKDQCAHLECKNARAHVQTFCAHMRARIFTKINFVVSSYLMNLSLKFCKDPCFR